MNHTEIRIQNLSDILSTVSDTPVSANILEHEIEGMDTLFHALPPGNRYGTETGSDRGRLYLFSSGNGTVEQEGSRFDIKEIALFIPVHQKPAIIKSGKEILSFLEIAVSLSQEDTDELESRQEKYPFFTSYSECTTYKEAIKSEKTINRTLLPEHTFPRLCIGSVQTNGPDRVDSHRHPMLEQLFFGLKGNCCIVRADDLKCRFNENVLLHIPLGSDHSVEVEQGCDLHYIWMDLFRSSSDMDYITETHLEDE